MKCKYCESYSFKVKSMHKDSKSYFSLLNEYMEVALSDNEIDTFKINYCPMCGKRINNYKDFE